MINRLFSGSSVITNESLTPVPAVGRVFGWRAHASIWFSLGVGLLVMQVGAYLYPGVGTHEALAAILLGSLCGAGLLGWASRVGCETGLSSAGLMHRVFGSGFARLPIFLNIVQLAGWAAFELVVMRDATVAIFRHALGWPMDGMSAQIFALLVWGAALVALLTGSMITLVRRFVARFGLPLVILSLLWLTWHFARGADWVSLWGRQGDGSMTLPSAFDLVIAMPVSWLPLVADYSRYGRTGRSALSGVWIGYALANAWCYGLGLLIITSVEPGSQLVSALLLAQGGLVALGLILIDELDNAYGDVHSASVSIHSVLPRWSVRIWGIAAGAACIALALLLPMHGLEPFLLMLSSVFVPLYGVILGRLGGGVAVLPDKAVRVDWIAAVLWVSGIAIYHAVAVWLPGWGSTIPSFAATFLLVRLTRGSAKASH